MQLELPFRAIGETRTGYLGGYRITQYFDTNPQNYARFSLAGHEGVDLALPNGTMLFAVHDAKVMRAGYDSAPYGIAVRLIWSAEGFQWEAIYAHMKKATVVVGTEVQAGTLLGYSNNTGNSTGPHLHFSLKKLGTVTPSRHSTRTYKDLVDPLPYFMEEVKPVEGTRVKVVASLGLRVRREPSLKATTVTTMPFGTVLTIKAFSHIEDGYVWYQLIEQKVYGVDITDCWIAVRSTSGNKLVQEL